MTLRQCLRACGKLDNFSRNLILAQLMLALRKSDKLRFYVGLGE